MLDQNTDRMWYVIGAIVIGAVIIASMMTVSPTSFEAVSDLFSGQLATTGGYIDRNLVASSGTTFYGESVQYGRPDPHNPVNIRHTNHIELNGELIELEQPLRGVGPSKDMLFYDSTNELWKVERKVKEVILTRDNRWRIEDNHWYVTFEDVSKYGYNTLISHFELTHGVFAERHLPARDEGVDTIGTRYGNNRVGLLHNINLLFFMPENGDLDGWLDWLDHNPITVVYELDEPNVEELSESMQVLLNDAMDVELEAVD